MKIVFYSTNSNEYRGQDFFTFTIKSAKDEWEDFLSLHPDFEIFIVTILPGSFLLDLENSSLREKCEKIKYIFLPPESSADEIALEIKNLNADKIIAATFYEKPYDWLGIKDAMVKEKLEGFGCKVFCNSLYSQVNSFDKFKSHIIFEKLNLPSPSYLYVHHTLFQVAGNRKDVKENVYKNYILHELSKMKYPLVIKDTVGLSSYSMEIAENFSMARDYLNSRKFNSDRLFEEFIDGLNFGLEIHGLPGNYKVLDPFIFSVNRYGLTSPKQSIKIGPVKNEDKFNLKELKRQALLLADHMAFEGLSQIDLIFKNGKWYFIEINPRLSGMSTSYAAAMGKNFYQMILESCECGQGKNDLSKFVMNFKIPLQKKEKLLALSKNKYVKHLKQIENLAHLQERDKGYCEIILGSFDSVGDLKKCFENFVEESGSLVEDVFRKKAGELFKILGCE